MKSNINSSSDSSKSNINPNNISMAEFIEAQKLAVTLSSMFNAMKIDEKVGMVALGLLMNSTIKQQITKGMDKARVIDMIMSAVQVVIKDVAEVTSGKDLHDIIKKGMCGVN